MQPWRAVRANCSFAKLVLQAPYSTARTHAPTESYAMSFVYLPIYTPAIPVKTSCKDNGSFSAACCFLSFLCNLSRSNYSRISCRSIIFHRVLSPFYLLIKSCLHIYVFCISVALQVHIVYLGHNNGLSPSLTTHSHLQLLSRVFTK